MALNKGKLVADLKSALNLNREQDDPDKAVEDLAKALADAFESYVKSGKVTVTVQGIITAGSPSTQTQTAPVIATGDPPTTGGIS